jgi:hypothetical protein
MTSVIAGPISGSAMSTLNCDDDRAEDDAEADESSVRA